MDLGAGFGGLLRQLRESAGMTQEELAARAGLSSKAVSLLERGERRRPYPHTVTALADALGAPADVRAELLAAVRQTTARVREEAAPAWTSPPTPLIGRDRELREVVGAVCAPQARLVTLTGTGGVGKTRLALGVLDQVAPLFARTVFVPLAPVSSADLVLLAVLRSLGVTERGREPLDALVDQLAGRRVLLVLDNFEHVLDAASDVAALIGRAPETVVLVTSRARLHLRGEVELAVPPLWTPETETATPEAVSSSPAGRLFVDRARAASTSFELTEANSADVAAICRHLSGIPLALEIVAARSRLLGPAQLLERLGGGLHHEGARDLPERHRTLRLALDWSHDLLGPPTRLGFAALSVFRGGFTLEGAESVMAALPEDIDALEVLADLVDQSLVVPDADHEQGSRRYRMLEPVRQYAAEQLAGRAWEVDVRLAHARHFLAIAEGAYRRVMGADQLLWLDLFATEHANLNAAIAWTAREGQGELAVRLAWSLRMYWLMRDARHEGRRLLELVLPYAEDLPTPTRARLFHVLAFCHYGYGGPQRELAERALDLFTQVDDQEGRQYAMGQLAFAHLVSGENDLAEENLRAALSLARELGDEPQAAHMLNHLAVIPLRAGDHRRATQLAGESLAITRRTGERLATQTSLQVLGQAAWGRGEPDLAREHFGQSLAVALELGDVVNVGYCLRGLALADGRDAASPWAARLLGAAAEVLEGAGHPTFAWAIGQLDDAASAAQESGRLDPVWGEAYAQGRAMELDDAVSLALSGDQRLALPGGARPTA